MPSWFALFQLVTAATASALWYLFPGSGAWPLLIGLAPWGMRLLRTGRPFRLTGFEVPLFLFLLAAAAAVWSAPEREVAEPKFWLIVGAVLLFYGVAGIGDRGSGIGDRGAGIGERGLGFGAWVLAGFGAVVALYFVATHEWDQFDVKLAAVERLGRALQAPLPAVPGHRLHPTVAGGLMALATPFTVALITSGARRAGGRWWAVAGAALLALTLLGLLLTVDRGAWVALAAAALVGGLWLALGRLAPEGGRRLLLLGAVLVALLGAALAVAWLRPELAVGAIERLPGGGNLARLTLYRDGLALAHDYPFIGAGLGSFMMLYSTYQLLIHVGFSVHSHNLFLDVAIEQGVVAAALLLVMWAIALAGWLWIVRRGSSEGGSRQLAGSGESHWVGAALLALVTVAVHGLVDDALYGSRAVILLFVPLAFTAPALRQAGLVRRLNVAVAVAALAAALLVAAVPGLRAAWFANLGAVEQGRAELALYSWPEWRLQDELRRELDLSPALAYYERALALDAGNFSANRRMGQIALSLAEYEAALAYLQRAYAAAPWDNATRQLYGEALIANGQAAEGARLWATVNNSQSQLSARTFWYGYIGDEERLMAMEAALPGAE